MTNAVLIEPCNPANDEQALQWLRRQPGGQVETTISALAIHLGWSRSMLRRRIAAWSDQGRIVRSPGSGGRSIILAVGHPAIGSADAAGQRPKPAEIRPAAAVPAGGPSKKTWINTAAFLAALLLASVSASFSILGLTAIFAAAFWPVLIMGVALEVGRLVTVAWLSGHWRSTPAALKWALTAMAMVLMAITSMGVFGFLTKAHVEHQIHATVLLADQSAAIDGQISLQAQAISDFDRRIAQIDAAVDEATKHGRAASAMALASHERQTRADLVAGRQSEARALVDLKVGKAVIDGERQRGQADVGPLRYLAQILGGADADLEKTVRLLILVIAAVFDPLAVLLLIAATRQPGTRVARCRSAYPFWQGGLGEIGRSRMPIALTRDLNACPDARSLSRPT